MIRSMFQALQDPDRLIIAGQNATINPGFHRFGSYISCVHDMVGPTLLVSAKVPILMDETWPSMTQGRNNTFWNMAE